MQGFRIQKFSAEKSAKNFALKLLDKKSCKNFLQIFLQKIPVCEILA